MASELKLPGNFAPGKKYWLDGKTLTAWQEALIADRIIPGKGLKESQGKKGRHLDLVDSTSGAVLPLQATIIGGTKLELLGGAYQLGATGAWVTIPPTAATTGTKAYLVINQTATRALAATDPVTVLVTSSTLDPVVITPAADPDPETAVSNVLLAEVVSGELIQRRHGNFTLGLWQIDGDVVRWPETVAGSIPTPAAP